MSRTPAQRGAQFKKGQSGNPNGRPRIPEDVKEAAKAYTVDAIQTLVDVMTTGKNDASRVNAAVAILNRGWGQPKQNVDIDVNHQQDWSALINAMNSYNATKALSQPVDQVMVIEAVEVKRLDDA